MEGKKKRKRIIAQSEKDQQRQSLKKSPAKSVKSAEYKSAHELVKSYQLKRDCVLHAHVDKIGKEVVEKSEMLPKKKREISEVARTCQVQNKNKTISDEAEMQSKMRPKIMGKMTTNEDEGQSKLLVKPKILPTKDQGHTKMSTERKMPTKEDGSQRQLSIKKKPMEESTNEAKGKIGGDSNHKLDNDEKEALIPALSLDEFFEKLGISEDVDEEYEHDYDDHVPTDDGKEKKKRTRGPTQLKHIRNMEGRLEIEWNANNGKLIGPSKKEVQLVSRFLGTLARDTDLVTLLYTNWLAVPKENRDSMLERARCKYTIPTNGEPWVLATIGEAWKKYKSRIKEKHYTPYSSFREIWKNRPGTIPDSHFRKLIRYWKLDVVKVVSNKNKKSRSKQKWNHRMGPVSFELIRNELESVHSLKESGYSDEDTFQTLFGKEQSGR
ncbi:hypothetical protein PIB30_103877, partial [Stylosanthes scabra]|nr:hypothetical protein [Stylosanthes scabra]